LFLWTDISLDSNVHNHLSPFTCSGNGKLVSLLWLCFNKSSCHFHCISRWCLGVLNDELLFKGVLHDWLLFNSLEESPEIKLGPLTRNAGR
jgi:hypothetical protein